jgi:hypothetical protein
MEQRTKNKPIIRQKSAGAVLGCFVPSSVLVLTARSYVVQLIPAWFQTQKSASPAAAWCIFIFFYENFARSAKFS